ncbi:hypothetical protein ACLB2K_023462 [Fragaria x ananassa]
MEDERQALLSFRHDLADPSGRLSSWIGYDCCQRRGISCNNLTGHVVKMDLSNTYCQHDYLEWDEVAYRRSLLKGKLNPSFLTLTHLDYLDLSCNDFELPFFIGQLKSLRYLNLSSFSSSQGEIPPHFGNLSNLSYLDLSANFLLTLTSRNLNWLSQLSSLKYLSLQYVDLTKTGVSWFHAVNKLPSLLELHLSLCQIGSIPLLVPKINITSLLILDMSKNYISSSIPSWLFNLTSLIKLNLSDTSFGGSISWESASFKDLEDLDLSSNRFEGPIPNLIGNSTKLKIINLSHNKFVGAIPERFLGCSGCRNDTLELLDLSFNMLECKLPDSLGMLHNLQYLNLQSNSFWGTIPESIGNLSSLQTLDLSYNHMNGSIPRSLGELSQLVHLDLSHNSWEGNLSEFYFKNLTRLKSLVVTTDQPMSLIFYVSYQWAAPFKLYTIDIRNCSIGPSFPAWLQSQTELLTATLSNTNISDSIPEELFLKLCVQIEYLDLSYNQIHGRLPLQMTCPTSMCNITNLAILTLRTNQLSGEFPEAWSLWSHILVIDVGYNNLSGHIPISMGVPSSLAILKLNNNHFGGTFPSLIFENCTNMKSIDLGSNQFTGNLPSMLPAELFILRLRSNFFSGHIVTG